MRARTKVAIAGALVAIAATPSIAVITSTARGEVPRDAPEAPLVSPDEAVAVVGEDNWVFYGNLFQNNYAQATGARTYTADEIDAFEAAVSGQQQWLERRGIPMYFAVMPAKWEIYPEKLPGAGEAPSILDQVLDAASTDSPLIDLRPALREARENADTYSKLNGHWTGYGGYVAWTELAERFAADSPALSVPPLPALSDVATIDQGNEFADLVGFPGPNEWTTPVLSQPLEPVQVVNADGSLAPPSEPTETDMTQMPFETLATGSANPGQLLAMCDSTCRALSPYLQAGFASVAQVQHQILTPAQRPNIPALIEQYSPTVVLYVMTQRYFDVGLQDGAFWAAANAFDEATTVLAESGATADPVATAPAQTPVVDSVVYGETGAVASITVGSEATGMLTVRDTASGLSTDLPVVAGANTVFVELPPATEPSTLSVSASTEAGQVSIQSAVVKAGA